MTRTAKQLTKCLATLLMISLEVSAQSFDDPNGPQNSSRLKQQGQLFTVQIVPGEPMRFFVVGREEAKIDLSQLTVTVRRLAPYPGKILKLDQKNDYFFAADPSELQFATELEVTAKSNAKAETMKFPIQNKN